MQARDALILKLVALVSSRCRLAQQVLQVPPRDILQVVAVARRGARLGEGVGDGGIGHAWLGAAAMGALRNTILALALEEGDIRRHSWHVTSWCARSLDNLNRPAA